MSEPKHLYSETEDVEDVLKQIEESFNITFQPNELAHINTFGELCDHIVPKITLSHEESCTNQQAFYKIRDAISLVLGIDKKALTINTNLSSLLPKQIRKSKISELEVILGFKLNILCVKDIFAFIFLGLFFASIIGLFFIWRIGLIGIVSSIIFIYVVDKTGKEFNIKTLGDLAEKMTLGHYSKMRRNPSTYNRNELITKIEKLFIYHLGLDDDFKSIPRDTIIIER